MAMTIGDANSVQALLTWLTGENKHDRDADLIADAARAAAIRLADRARDALSAGMDGQTVASRWPVPGIPAGAVAPVVAARGER